MLQFDGLSRFCNIFHFISTRQGGVSKGAYESFNLGVYCKDAPEAVRVNRQMLCSAIGIPDHRLFAPYQTHEDKIVHIDASFLNLRADEQEKELHGIDALITDQPGLAIAVSTADCVPVLLYAPEKQVVAAIHAGWRSTVKQIVVQTAERLIREFDCDPYTIVAGIGPSICQDRFEVGEEVGDTFSAAGIDLAPIAVRHPGTGKLHIDLWEANRLQLIQAGILPEHIEIAGLCTYTHSDLFFSARRQGLNSGRMLSGIGLHLPAND